MNLDKIKVIAHAAHGHSSGRGRRFSGGGRLALARPASALPRLRRRLPSTKAAWGRCSLWTRPWKR